LMFFANTSVIPYNPPKKILSTSAYMPSPLPLSHHALLPSHHHFSVSSTFPIIPHLILSPSPMSQCSLTISHCPQWRPNVPSPSPIVPNDVPMFPHHLPLSPMASQC
jgi:hypothetical protein